MCGWMGGWMDGLHWAHSHAHAWSSRKCVSDWGYQNAGTCVVVVRREGSPPTRPTHPKSHLLTPNTEAANAG
jgi:hypothetical protein